MIKLFLLITLIFTLTKVKSQEIHKFPMNKSSLLWKINSSNIKSESYLFGTMHLIEKDYFFFPEKLKDIVSKTDQLVLEISDINTTHAIKYLTLNEGSFFDFFNPAQIDSIFFWAKEKLSIKENIFRANFSKMKPFVILQMATQMQFIGETESYDVTLNKIAKEKNIEVKGLETIEQQINLFDNLSDKQQAEMIMSEIRDSDKSMNMIKRIQDIYISQNVDSLYQIINSNGGIIVEEQENFLDGRNKNWITQIIKLIEEKDTFIAVGAGHLGGPNGIIRLLEKEGYTLTPIKI